MILTSKEIIILFLVIYLIFIIAALAMVKRRQSGRVRDRDDIRKEKNSKQGFSEV